jgi:hypothetical protein
VSARLAGWLASGEGLHAPALTPFEVANGLTRRLERQSAYDAAYLALAQDLDGECWTLDGRLVRNATRLGLPVRLVAS